MGKVAKTLKDVQMTSKSLQEDLENLHTIRNNTPSRTGDHLKIIQRRARICKASMSHCVTVLRQYLMKDMDKFLQDINTNIVKLEQAHTNFDTTEMDKILTNITDMKTQVPDLTSNIEEAISYFQNKEDSTVGDGKSVNVPSTASSQDDSTVADGKSVTVPSTITGTASSQDTQETLFSDDDDDEAEYLTLEKLHEKDDEKDNQNE